MIREKLLVLSVLIFVFCCVLAVDPWDLKGRNLKEAETRLEKTCENKICTGDIFYKKLIALLHENAYIEENNNGYDLSISFHFPEDKYKLLQSYIKENENRLSDHAMRSIDGIFSNNIRKKGFAQKGLDLTNDYVIPFLKKIWAQLLFASAVLLSCVALYKLNWSNIPAKWLLIGVSAVVVYAWEVRILIEEAQNDEMTQYFKQCTYDFIFYQYVKPNCFTTKTVSYFWQHGNPIHVIPRIFSKLFLNNLLTVLTTVNKAILDLCGNVNVFWFTPVYVTLCITFYGILLFFTVAIIGNYFFNQSFSMNFLFFNFKLRERFNNYRMDHHPQMAVQHQQIQSIQNQPNQNSLSGESVTHLISAMKELVQHSTRESQIKAIPNVDSSAKDQVVEFKEPTMRPKLYVNFKTRHQERKSKLRRKAGLSYTDYYKSGAGDHVS